SPTPVRPALSVSSSRLRVKNGPCAPLRLSSMLSRPATGITRDCVMRGVAVEVIVGLEWRGAGLGSHAPRMVAPRQRAAGEIGRPVRGERLLARFADVDPSSCSNGAPRTTVLALVRALTGSRRIDRGAQRSDIDGVPGRGACGHRGGQAGA